LDNQASADQDRENDRPLIDAVVSPDAALYLGILNGVNLVNEDTGSYHYGLIRGGKKNWNLGAFDGDDNMDVVGAMRAIGAQAFGYTSDQNDDIKNQMWRTSAAGAFAGFNVAPITRPCYFTFVEDDFPLGVVPGYMVNPMYFEYDQELDKTSGKWTSENNYIIGFGRPVAFKGDIPKADYNDANSFGYEGGDFSDNKYTFAGYMKEVLEDPPQNNDAIIKDMFVPLNGVSLAKYNADTEFFESTFGGNNINYFTYIMGNGNQIPSDVSKLSKENMFKDYQSNDPRSLYKDVFDVFSSPKISTESRRNYDEDYDASVRVIAGDGRTLAEAREIWDFFRIVFHEDKMVKSLFKSAFGLNPDSDEKLPDIILKLLLNDKSADTAKIFPRYQSSFSSPEEARFGVAGSKVYNSALPEFNTVLDLNLDSITDPRKKEIEEAVNYSSKIFLDEETVTEIDGEKTTITPLFGDLDNLLKKTYTYMTGLIGYLLGFKASQTGTDKLFSEVKDEEDYNLKSVIGFRQFLLFQDGEEQRVDDQKARDAIARIDTPKKLYYFMVGWFRNVLWNDPYSRAWLVLKPNRRLRHYTKRPFENNFTGGLKEYDGKWDFSPVYQAWQAFIDPYSDYAKKPNKFKEFLISTAREGDSATSWWQAAFNDVNDFYDRNMGIYFTAISDGLSGLLNMFKLSMAQMGYGLSEVDNLNKQANVLNKLLNDSIYYSLGNEGSMLRAIDNPFTREYGEPVVEVREPFQRIHYISSFSHILTNKIEENITDVATVVTAVSDGKYPVTVALDKAAPPERQTEITVETGLYFDNIRGSGFFGMLHPFFHPLETFRGLSKNMQGSPDELSAKRVAASYLKENVKDIYSGELTLIGNADIRPHDLVYLADVYERMYGIFEVEQVVHHFTPDMGFVTSITPNALVTMNDPARWFMTSWLNSWMSLQTIRNDTRYYLSVANRGRTGLVTSGQVSLDQLNDALSSQMMGGIQHTHGSSALMKDVMANFAANAIPDAKERLIKAAVNAGGTDKTARGAAIAGLVTTGVATVLGAGAAIGLTALTGGAAVPVLAAAGAAFAGGSIGGDLAWTGWKHIRDNLLDQHGCYVQYLSKNGQPMDAGLSYNQGMVVGKYHSKALLPWLLGVNSRKLVRTPEGYAYIRTDDLLKNLGWKEKEISDLVRHISYENALVNAEVIKYAGIGPEKAGLNQFFKVLCKVHRFIDGDTVDVVDVLRPESAPFRVRFEGINAAELNRMSGAVNLTNQRSGLRRISAVNGNRGN
jgi:hypothetical protein